METIKPRWAPPSGPAPLDRIEPCSHAHCDGRQGRVRALVCSNGTTQFKYQCLTCGGSLGDALKRTAIAHLQPIESFDIALRERTETWYKARSIESARLEAVEQEAWRARYEAHLDSPEWREARRPVLARSGGRCEHCHEGPVEHVHHVTYERLGAELPEDLLGLCRPCHHAVHHRVF